MKEVALVFIVLYTLSALSNGFSVDLIHRDSPLSPFYNYSMSQTEVLRNAALRSISRANSFDFSADNGNKAETVIVPNQGDYLMKIFIGNPPVESLVTADTASDLIWVQCLPCASCYAQQAPIFDPKKSSTYELVTCSSDSCHLLPNSSCGTAGECRYSYGYGDKSVTMGELAKDVISLGGFNGGMFDDSPLEPPPKTIFGCGHNNTGIFSSTGIGTIGLGRAPLSLVSQLGSIIGRVFSYCLVPMGTNSTSKLTFAWKSSLTGPGIVSTPLLTDKAPSPTNYYLSLEGISIDETKVTPLQSVGNIIVDSGTTLTFLETSFYSVVETAIAEAVDEVAMRDPPSPYRLCYRGAKEIPNVTFNFAGGANILLPVNNVFVNLPRDTTCLLMLPRDGYSVFGTLAQTNFQVEYDTDGGKVSFAPADCTQE